MVRFRILPRAKGKDIDLPDSISHRTCKSSLLLIPGQSHTVTDEEWDFIKKNHPDILPGVQVLSGEK